MEEISYCNGQRGVPSAMLLCRREDIQFVIVISLNVNEALQLCTPDHCNLPRKFLCDAYHSTISPMSKKIPSVKAKKLEVHECQSSLQNLFFFRG